MRYDKITLNRAEQSAENRKKEEEETRQGVIGKWDMGMCE